jgi:hypothetical protein
MHSAAFAVLICVACFASASPTVLGDSLRVDDVVSGYVKYGRRTFALPPGEWRVVHTRERSSSSTGQGATMLEVAFDQIVGARLSRTLELVATKYSNNINWIDEPCKTQGDAYWMYDRGRGFNDQFCVRVGFKSNVIDGARGEAFQAWARGIVSQGTGYSREMPFVRVVRFTSYDYLQMTISFDPAVVGITPSQRSDRQFNDWHPQLIPQHPDKTAFYEQLKAWAPTFASAVERAFNGDKTLTPQEFGEPAFAPRR